MAIDIQPASPEAIQPFQERYRSELACQIVYDSMIRRGLSAPYLLVCEGEAVGYASVFAVGDAPKDLVDCFFVDVAHRRDASALYSAFLEEVRPKTLQAQTNDPLALRMLLDFGTDPRTDRILFDDGFAAGLEVPGADLRESTSADNDRPYGSEATFDGAGEWLVELDGAIVAAGGVLDHYNPPYGDIYMSVANTHRRRGLGSFMVQELRRIAREKGHEPAARCNATNQASRATLQRGGMRICGAIVHATAPTSG